MNVEDTDLQCNPSGKLLLRCNVDVQNVENVNLKMTLSVLFDPLLKDPAEASCPPQMFGEF
jgi:hypothetical protein